MVYRSQKRSGKHVFEDLESDEGTRVCRWWVRGTLTG
jgi:hypothetical protein